MWDVVNVQRLAPGDQVRVAGIHGRVASIEVHPEAAMLVIESDSGTRCFVGSPKSRVARGRMAATHMQSAKVS